MAKKNKPKEIPSWIKDLYKEDLDRVVRGERPMYFRGMNDGPLKNVSPEFDVLSGGAAVKGMNGIRGTLSPLNNGMGNYNFSIRGINKKIGEPVDEAGLYLPEKLRPIYQTVVDAMSRSKDKGLGHITQPLANALYPADERRNRRLDGEHPVGYVDAIDGIWPREKYGLWGEKIERKAEGGPTGNDPMYVRQDVSDRASYLKDIIGNAIRRRLYENVTPDVVASNASLPDKVKEFIYGRNGKANVDEYSEQLWGRFLSQPNSLDGNSKEIRIPDNVITDIEKMFNRDTKDEIKRLDKKIRDTEQEIYGSDKLATDDAYGRLKLLKKSREWVDIFEKNRNSVRSGKPTVFSEYDFYPEAAGDLTPLSGFGNFTIYRRPDGRLGVYDVYDFYSNDQEFPVNIVTKTLDAIGDKFEERGSFKDYSPIQESGRDALIRNAIMSKNKLEKKYDGGYIASKDNTSVGGPGINMNTRYDTKPYQDPLTPVISGFVPGLDVASDVSDMATAIEDKDKIGMILASLGFLPVVGGAASYASKARKLDGRVKAIRISEPPEKPVYYHNKLSDGVTHGDVVDADKNDFKLTSNLFFERGFYPRFERMMDELGKNVRRPYKSGMLLEEDKDFIKKMKGKDGSVVIPEKNTPLRFELDRMLSDYGIEDQEAAWNRWINYANSKKSYDNRESILDGVKNMIKKPDTYDFDFVDGLSMNGHVISGVHMKDGDKMLIDANLPYNQKLTTMIHETRHRIGQYIDNTFGKTFRHGLTKPADKTVDLIYKTLNYDDFLDNANHIWEKSATNTELQFLMEKLRGYESTMDDIGKVYGDDKMRDIIKNISDDDIKSLLGEINSDYSGKYIKALNKGEMNYDDVRKALMYPIISGLMYKSYDAISSGDEDKNKMNKGGSVNTGRAYGDGKYVVDPRRSEDSKMAVYDEIWDYLTDKKGIPQTQAIGILSNIAAESGGDTDALGAAGDFGIQQWLGPRKKELQRRYGKKPTLTQQLDYLVDEYQGKVPGLGWNYINQGKFFDKDAQGNVYNYYMYSKSDFDNAVNYKDATVAWNQGYGRPLGSTLRNERRFELADMFAGRYGVPEDEPMRYGFGQPDSDTGDGGQEPAHGAATPANPSLASRPAMDSWWEREGQDLLYRMLAQSGANRKAIEDIANNIKDDDRSEEQMAEAERIRREQAKRQLVLDMIPGLMLNIKGMSSVKSGGGLVDDNGWFYDEARRKQVVDKQNTIRSLSEEKHKILKSSRLALEQGFIDEDQFRRINNLPVFKLSDDVKSDGGNNKEAELINSLFDTAMYDSFGKSVKEQSVEEEKNRKERFYPYKLMADSLLTIGDIATASPGFLRLIERSGARLYPLLNNIAHSNSIQKISGLSGIGVDSSQIALDPDDDNLWNILGVAGAAAELIGGMDILRNTSVMGRIGDRLDDILDIANPVVTLGGLADDVLN
jgi:hypothetical protein